MTLTDARSVTDPENDHLEVKLRNAIGSSRFRHHHLTVVTMRAERGATVDTMPATGGIRARIERYLVSAFGQRPRFRSEDDGHARRRQRHRIRPWGRPTIRIASDGREHRV